MGKPVNNLSRITRAILSLTLFAYAILPLFLSTAVQATADQMDRTVLPIPPRPFEGHVRRIPAESEPSFPKPVPAPEGAPNVVLIMTDDIGFGSASTFGGAIPTPNLDRLAQMGVVYNNFHTAAMCSPTRAALLTGRNPHSVSFGSIGELKMGYPGYWGEVPPSAASIATVLKYNGFNTAMFGKEHNVPNSQSSPAGPFYLWPSTRGFEYFYGFIGGAMNQFHPRLFQNRVAVDMSDKPSDYILDRDLFDHAIDWVHTQKAVAPDKPFFLYLAPGSAHAPHQAPADWIEKFHGQFDQGWDALRQQIFEQQRRLGIVPKNTKLTPRPDIIPPWDSLTPVEQKVQARMMEVYAAMIAFQDYQFGRLLSELERMGVIDNTLLIFIEGDNGGTAEGGLNGEINLAGMMANGVTETTSMMFKRLDEFGGPRTDLLYSVGWGWAVNAPFQWTKQVASHLGGTRNPMVISWPGHVPSGGRLRSQYSYVSDIYPTILEAAGLKAPTRVDGVDQQPLDGISLVYTFNNADAPSRRTEQVYELLGNRAIYKDGWLANTTPKRVPWYYGPMEGSPLDYDWELYYLPDDYSQAVDLADGHPEKLAQLQKRWDVLAKEQNIYPISDDISDRNFADVSTRKELRDNFGYWGADISVPQTFGPSLANRAFTIEADLADDEDRLNGVIAAVGGNLGGWSFYIENHRPVVYLTRSALRDEQYRIIGEPLPAGEVTLRYEFTYEGTGRNGPGSMRIYANGDLVGEGRFDRTLSSPVGFGETFDTGRDTGAPVSPDYEGENPLCGRLLRLTVTLDSL